MTDLGLIIIAWFVLVVLIIFLTYYQHKKGLLEVTYDYEEVPYKLEPQDVRPEEANKGDNIIQEKQNNK